MRFTEPPTLVDLSREERVAAMAEWFGENFEDPAEKTPYESAEGGYQYIWGGPFDARDVLGNTFPDATDEEIDLAVEGIEKDGIVDWAPSDIGDDEPEPVLHPPSNPTSLAGLERGERIDAMAEWFWQNFEDPANSTPYDSEEGGYQYIWGGPFQARDEISAAFHNANQDEIDTAVAQVEESGIAYWAPAESRIWPDDQGVEVAPTTEKLLQRPVTVRAQTTGNPSLGMEVIRSSDRIKQLEALIDETERELRTCLPVLEWAETEWKQSGLMGHNNPPGGLSTPSNTLQAVQRAIEITNVFRTEISRPEPRLKVLAECIKLIEAAAEKLCSFFTCLAKRPLSWLAQGMILKFGNDFMADLLARYPHAIHDLISRIFDLSKLVGH